MNLKDTNKPQSVSQTVLPNENTDYLGIFEVDSRELDSIMDAYSGTSDYQGSDY